MEGWVLVLVIGSIGVLIWVFLQPVFNKFEKKVVIRGDDREEIIPLLNRNMARVLFPDLSNGSGFEAGAGYMDVGATPSNGDVEIEIISPEGNKVLNVAEGGGEAVDAEEDLGDVENDGEFEHNDEQDEEDVGEEGGGDVFKRLRALERRVKRLEDWVSHIDRDVEALKEIKMKKMDVREVGGVEGVYISDDIIYLADDQPFKHNGRYYVTKMFYAKYVGMTPPGVDKRIKRGFYPKLLAKLYLHGKPRRIYVLPLSMLVKEMKSRGLEVPKEFIEMLKEEEEEIKKMERENLEEVGGE